MTTVLSDLSPYLAKTLLATGFCVACTLLLRKRRVSVDLPPSPKADFGIGHLRKIPLGFQWKTFAEWRKSLGESYLANYTDDSHCGHEGNIFYLNVLGNEMIVLNSVDDARELFDKKGTSYSNRPRGVFVTEV